MALHPARSPRWFGAALLLSWAAFGVACSSKVNSPEPFVERVDALFADWDSPAKPGCSLAVSRHGAVVFQRGYGRANLEYGASNRPNTRFHVASLSKQFTAAALVLLVLEGRVALDDTIDRYLPELARLGESIRVRHLLHHTSGLRDQWEILDLSGWRYARDHITDEDVMGVLARQKLLKFEPGSRYDYSNTNYMLVAQIVARVSGQSLREFTRRRLFEPLGMSDTFFRDDFSEVVPHFAYGYEERGGVFKTSTTNFSTVGPSSLISTVEDLMKWEENFLSGRVGGAAFIELMLEREPLTDGAPNDYALGVVHGSRRGLPIVDHVGSDAGYGAYLVRYPEQRLSVAVLCNVDSADASRLAEGVADFYLELGDRPDQEARRPAEEKPPERGAPLSLTNEELVRYVGVYRSDEIDVLYRVERVEEGLELRAVKIRVALTPSTEELFSCEHGDVRFQFADDGTVSGFLLGEDAPYRFVKLEPEGAASE